MNSAGIGMSRWVPPVQFSADHGTLAVWIELRQGPMRWLKPILFFIALFTTASSLRADPIRIEGGSIQGMQAEGLNTYFGIPFAAPPVGPLRWRPPQAPSPWEGIKAAEKFSPICMQRGSYPEDAPPEPMSEDCLYLNIWVPPATNGARLP